MSNPIHVEGTAVVAVVQYPNGETEVISYIVGMDTLSDTTILASQEFQFSMQAETKDVRD